MIKELLEKVKEQNLTKSALEQYRDEMSNLFAECHLELADLEKSEALYFLDKKAHSDTLLSDIAIKRAWKGTDKGQRMIELTHTAKALEKMLSSLKSRIYATY